MNMSPTLVTCDRLNMSPRKEVLKNLGLKGDRLGCKFKHVTETCHSVSHCFMDLNDMVTRVTSYMYVLKEKLKSVR